MDKNEIIENFIVFEGLDGAGTTTQANLLEASYKNNKLPCINSCEPTKGFIGKAIREVLSGDIKVASGTIAKLFVSDRHEHLYNPSEGIIKRCKTGYFVISDRYLFSSLAYQSLDFGFDNVLELNKSFPLPEHLFFLDVPPDICHNRLSSRDKLEIYENINLQKNILFNYKKSLDVYSNTDMQIHLIDGTNDIEEIGKIVWRNLNPDPIS
ncbi:MAG: dTMP kinase [Spirochaetia bacterium]|jgi:dTMP kinase|nr:dTMP kinase [Spirochaetia bacterium]